MPTSQSSATWKRGLRDGEGEFRAASEAFTGRYSVPTRFEGAGGTNPEELLAAAHASCLSMAVAGGVEGEGHTPEVIRTEASCTLETDDGEARVSRMKLTVRGRVPGMDEEAFRRAVEAGSRQCPISRALKGNLDVEVEGQLEE